MSRLDDATTSRLYIEISTESPSRFESIQDESKLQKFLESKVYFGQSYLVISINNFVYREYIRGITWNSKTLERRESMEYMVWDDERSIDRCAGDSRWTDAD